MNKKTSRRLFLRNTAMATIGIAFLSMSSPMHALTKNEGPFDGYNPYAEAKTDLRSSFLFNTSVTVKGTLYDSTGNIPVANAKIEVWHLSPGTTKFNHRGKMLTDSNGYYEFITDKPNRKKGQQQHIYFKVSKKNTTYFTELIFNDLRAHISCKHWKTQHVLGEKKLFPKMKTHYNTLEIIFNLSLNTNQYI